MSPSSQTILQYIASHPGCTSRDLATHFGVSLTSMSSKTSRLHDQGYIAREPEDLRQAPRGMCYRLWVVS